MADAFAGAVRPGFFRDRAPWLTATALLQTQSGARVRKYASSGKLRGSRSRRGAAMSGTQHVRDAEVQFGFEEDPPSAGSASAEIERPVQQAEQVCSRRAHDAELAVATCIARHQRSPRRGAPAPPPDLRTVAGLRAGGAMP